MAEVTSTPGGSTVIVLDESETEQLTIFLGLGSDVFPFPAALLDLADALDVEVNSDPEYGEV